MTVWAKDIFLIASLCEIHSSGAGAAVWFGVLFFARGQITTTGSCFNQGLVGVGIKKMFLMSFSYKVLSL